MATTIQDIRDSNAAPQRAFAWEIDLTSSNSIGQLELLTARAQNMTIPEKSFETIEINYKSRKSRYSGRDSSPGTFTVTFFDDETHAVYNFFENWAENGLSNSRTGGGLTRPEYAAELHAKLLAHDETTVLGQHKFERVWPSSVGEISLSYSESEHVTFDVTFTYDVHTKTGGSGGSGSSGSGGGQGIMV